MTTTINHESGYSATVDVQPYELLADFTIHSPTGTVVTVFHDHIGFRTGRAHSTVEDWIKHRAFQHLTGSAVASHKRKTAREQREASCDHEWVYRKPYHDDDSEFVCRYCGAAEMGEMKVATDLVDLEDRGIL